MKTAEQVLLESLDELLVQQDADLIIPYSKVNKAITDVVQQNAKVITKMADRILREADKHITATGDVLDSIQTRVLQGLDTYAWDQEYLLSHLAAKSGMIQPGDPLEAALIQQAVDAPQLAYAGTLVLAVHEAVPWLERIATALEVMVAWMPREPLIDRITDVAQDDLLAGLLDSQSVGETGGGQRGVIQSTMVRLWQLEQEVDRAEIPQVSMGESVDPMQSGVPPQAWLDAAGGLLEAYRQLMTPVADDPFTRGLESIFRGGFNPRMLGD